MITTPDFTFADGLTHGLVGRNGIGKTTLLRTIAGQRRGKGVRVDGQDPFDNQQVMDGLVLMGIDNPLPAGWNLKKVFRIAATRWPSWDEQRARELVRRFELPMKNYSGLSRGQKSAAGFIVAVASGVPRMLLDEPYLGLDVPKREVFTEVLREEKQRGDKQRTIIMSTHHLNEVSGLLDAVAVMGAHPLSGPIEDFIEGIIELTGPAAQIDRALERLALQPLVREDTPLGARALVDARPNPEGVFDAAASLSLRATEVTLEEAVMALEGE
ncbi:AAA family ATPase [Corynebacterium sp.]|uniref:AAA family ATPase n=1 Tax=Corynebacterium sp. TaxID=1720 RepID=UPI0026DC00E7|nr:AAA family ATPase [Corynebacterium sp.]MDO5033204.1 ATP-binding cassette domain-containing protein [Corynebacterium sp.]